MVCRRLHDPANSPGYLQRVNYTVWEFFLNIFSLKKIQSSKILGFREGKA